MFFPTNKPELETATATAVVDESWFRVTCPACGQETLVSLYTRDGDMCDCDACSVGQFWFAAGAYAAARKREQE